MCVKLNSDVIKIILAYCGEFYQYDYKLLDLLSRYNIYYHDSFYYAVICEHEKTIKYLIEEKKYDVNELNKGYQNDFLELACNTGNLNIVKLIIKGGFKHDESDYAGQYVSGYREDRKGYVWNAYQNRYIDIMKYLLSIGHDINDYISSSPCYGTPLMCACEKGDMETAVYLIKNGASVDRITETENRDDEFTALYYACANGHYQIAKLLIANGADINEGGYHNDTPLIWSTINNHPNIVEILLYNNADVNIMYSDDDCCEFYEMTPIEIAKKKNHDEIINMFKHCL